MVDALASGASGGNPVEVQVLSSARKYFRMKYRFNGKEKTLSFGVYPDISLRVAREKCGEARSLLAEGVDPNVVRQAEKQRRRHGNTFQEVTEQWWEHNRWKWKDEHAQKIWTRLEHYVFSHIGNVPIIDLTTQQCIQILKSAEDRGYTDVPSRIKQYIESICCYAVQHQLLPTSPASDLKGILKPQKARHYPALPLRELPQFLCDLAGYHQTGRLLTQLALKLLLLTFVRSGELRGAVWDEFDFNDRMWRIPAERMKMKRPHVVPLSRQAIDILEQIRPITGRGELVFPSERRWQAPMSDNTLRRAIYRMGYDGKTKGKSKTVPHGFRTTATTALKEKGFLVDAVERQLAHAEENAVIDAYSHMAVYMDTRIPMMQWWADYLDALEHDLPQSPIPGRSH